MFTSAKSGCDRLWFPHTAVIQTLVWECCIGLNAVQMRMSAKRNLDKSDTQYIVVRRPEVSKQLGYPATWQEFCVWFPDDQPCAAYRERLRWPEGFPCPGCASEQGSGSTDNILAPLHGLTLPLFLGKLGLIDLWPQAAMNEHYLSGS